MDNDKVLQGKIGKFFMKRNHFLTHGEEFLVKVLPLKISI